MMNCFDAGGSISGSMRCSSRMFPMRNPAMKPVENWVKLSVLPPIGAAVIRGLARSMCIETKGQESIDALYQTGKHVIIAFWHARQLMMPLTYRGAQAHILISQHLDGEIIARIVERFGFKAIRGSSTRGGVEALREMIRLGRSGVDLVVTPDTGTAWAVAFEQMPKIVMVSHASQENITKHWINTTTLHADRHRVPCWPCHRLHDDISTCIPNKQNNGAACISDISVETLVQTVAEKWDRSRNVVHLVQPMVRVPG